LRPLLFFRKKYKKVTRSREGTTGVVPLSGKQFRRQKREKPSFPMSDSNKEKAFGYSELVQGMETKGLTHLLIHVMHVHPSSSFVLLHRSTRFQSQTMRARYHSFAWRRRRTGPSEQARMCLADMLLSRIDETGWWLLFVMSVHV
jgi:hypothetical protein